jgi:hypothetical protein
MIFPLLLFHITFFSIHPIEANHLEALLFKVDSHALKGGAYGALAGQSPQ